MISDEQIKQIANSIVLDVHSYITEHQEEFEKFLVEEASINNEQCSKIKKEEILYGKENQS